MKTPRISVISGTALLLMIGIGPVTGQITYTRLLANGNQELRQMRSNGAADNRLPLPFNRVGYPEWSRTVDWSPNGGQLVFDLALQATNSVVGPLQQGDPRTNQIYVINANGTGLRQLRGNGNGTPSWR